MGLKRTIGATVLLAGAIGAGIMAGPSAVQAQDGGIGLDAGSIARVQMLGPDRVLTEAEAAQLLRAEGFEIVEMGRTLLGRIRIVAAGPQGTREIVLHPSDGRVLRDIFTETEQPTAVILPAPPLEVTVALTPEPPAVSDPPSVVEEEPPVEVQAEPPSEAPIDLSASAPEVPPEVVAEAAP